GKLAGREIGEFPQLGLAMVGAALAGNIGTAVRHRQMLALTEIFHELRGQIAGHWSFRSRPHFYSVDGSRNVGRPSIMVAGSRTVIDPKYDSRAKRAGRRSPKRFDR